MTMETCGKNLAIKMIDIMNDVQYIQKTGYNSFHNYKYAKESDISEAFSKALIKNKVFMFSSILSYDSKAYKTRKGADTFLVTVKLELTFIDAESGESFTTTFFGDGSDSDDKGVYKAITGAQKYALLKTFLVATGDDPEQDEGDKRRDEPAFNGTLNNVIGSIHQAITGSEPSASHVEMMPILTGLINKSSNPNKTIQAILKASGVEKLIFLTDNEMKKWIEYLESKIKGDV